MFNRLSLFRGLLQPWTSKPRDELSSGGNGPLIQQAAGHNAKRRRPYDELQRMDGRRDVDLDGDWRIAGGPAGCRH